MRTFLKVGINLFLLFALTQTGFAQLNGNYNVGVGQTYTSLTGSGAAGFFNAVNTQGLSGNVTVTIVSDITETGVVSLNQWAGTNTLTIRPQNTTLRNLIGTDTISLFDFNGADRVIIDGRSGGSGRYLRFVNLSTAGSTFRFTNASNNDTIRYCIIEGENASATSGTIDFATVTGGTVGNDNNAITNCLIRDVTAGPVGTPLNAIWSNGSTTATNRHNKNILISNNEISNFYRNAQNSAAISLNGGSRDWTITGNSFYQSVTRTNANSAGWNIILVNTANATNITITSNFFGGSAASCGGSAWTVNGNVSNYLYVIRFSNAGTSSASNIQGNTIQNISLTSNPSTSATIYFVGILVENGLVDIGTTTGNVIGNTSSNGNIALTFNGSTDNIINRGIDHRGSGNINNNTVGSINIGGVNDETIRLECINYSGTPASNPSISSNTVGSTTTGNSIQQTSNTFACQLTGIHSAITTRTVTMNSNTISNLRVTSADSTSRIRGLFQARSTTAPVNITNNTISNLYCSGSALSRYPDACMLVGLFTGSSSVTQAVTGNTISGLYGTGNSNSHVMGFSFYSNVAKGQFINNKIYNLNHSSTTGAPVIWGINGFWGSWEFYNNQISITNGEATDSHNNPGTETTAQTTNTAPRHTNESVTDGPDPGTNLVHEEAQLDAALDKTTSPGGIGDFSTNAAEIKGIHDEAEFACVYYYNSVYIGGSAAGGSAISWAYDRPLSAWPTPATIRNNIFFNARTGGSGKHFAIGNEIGSTNWTNTSSNYNVFIAPNSSAIATWALADQSIQQWRTSSLGDKHSWSTTNASVSAANLFTNVTTGDLTIRTGNFEAWIVSGKGLAIAGQSTDFQGNTRPTAVTGGCSDIGCDEFSATPPNNPLATVDNPPGSGVTSNYTLWGRVLVTIEWGTGGSSYPSSMQVNYYSGVNPGGTLGGGYSNSHWIVTPVGSLTGATYDITINFGDNETYNIATPSSNTRIAKYDGTWEVYPSGTGPWQSELNWANYFVKTRGIDRFSTFTLTDGSNPLPVEMCSFNGLVSNRNVDLTWVTCWEMNNMGFDVERSTFNAAANSYGEWVKVGFVEGRGTTNEEQTYKFRDARLITGKYQYRLKQIDYNNNTEYHNLPGEMVVGKPNVADLFQNYPNPSNPSSKVDFQIPFSGKVSLKVYNTMGQEVATLIDKQLDAGFYSSVFDGSSLASGVYFYRLIAESPEGNSFNKTMKLVLVK